MSVETVKSIIAETLDRLHEVISGSLPLEITIVLSGEGTMHNSLMVGDHHPERLVEVVTHLSRLPGHEVTAEGRVEQELKK